MRSGKLTLQRALVRKKAFLYGFFFCRDAIYKQTVPIAWEPSLFFILVLNVAVCEKNTTHLGNLTLALYNANVCRWETIWQLQLFKKVSSYKLTKSGIFPRANFFLFIIIFNQCCYGSELYEILIMTDKNCTGLCAFAGVFCHVAGASLNTEGECCAALRFFAALGHSVRQAKPLKIPKAALR